MILLAETTIIMAEQKTSNQRNTSSRSSASQNAPRKNSRAEAEKKAQAKRRSILEDIIVIVVVAIAVLCYVALFSSAIPWLKTALYFLFGKLMYVAPLLFVILAVVLRIGDRTGLFIQRVVSVILVLFAVSGLFSFFGGDPKDGGLLGRLNYLMMNKLLGTAGSTVINIFLIVVAVVLFVDFSVFNYLKDRKDPEREENQRKRALHEEKREAKRRTRQLESELRAREEIDEIHEKNRRMEAEERLNRRFVGIGDTTITSDDETPTTFKYGDSDASAKNASIFNKYKNSGKDQKNTPVKEDADDVPFDLGDEIFMPPIHLGDEYLPKDDGILTSETPEETPEEKAEKADKAFREQLSPSDRYEKIVVTANGSVRKVETDGQKALRNKEVIDTDALRRARGEQALNPDGTPKEESPETAQKSETPSGNQTDDDVITRDIAAKKAVQKEYRFPPMRLLRRGAGVNGSRQDIEAELQENARNLVETLKTFGINVRVTNITRGPSVTRYEIQPDVGVKVSRITSLADNIKMNLAAASIYMEAPIPGKSAIGIQVPNSQKTGVTLRDLLESDEFKNHTSKLAFGLGKDIEGRAIIADIARMPHLLIAGTTGSGKSVCQNTMIMSIIYHAKPTEVKMIMIDPKMVEMQVYNDLPHLLLPVITDAKKASLALNWACTEMDRRYEIFARFAVRGIEGYNDYVNMEQPEDENGNPLEPMPEIVIFCDEMSDMMMQARKEVEGSVIRLAQKARAAGIHLVLATQTPRADIVTGLIKANLPSRIALKVNSGLESRIVLDMNGAEELLGHGDMLYFPMTENKPSRIQGAFVSDEELRDVMKYIREQKDVKGGGVDRNIRLDKPEESSAEETSSGGSGKPGSDKDELLYDCGRFIIETQKASIGALQRKFSIGFNRAARIMDQLAEAGVVGEEEGTKPRRILMGLDQFNNMQNE